MWSKFLSFGQISHFWRNLTILAKSHNFWQNFIILTNIFRIVAPAADGRFYPAVIQAVKTYEDRLTENRYTVRWEGGSRKVSEFLETDLIWGGGVIRGAELLPGQRVYITHLGREMEGTIAVHDREADSLVVNLAVSLAILRPRLLVPLKEERGRTVVSLSLYIHGARWKATIEQHMATILLLPPILDLCFYTFHLPTSPNTTKTCETDLD